MVNRTKRTRREPARSAAAHQDMVRSAVALHVTTTENLPCVLKLKSSDPADREEGCTDVAHLSQARANLDVLAVNNVPAAVAAALGDSNIHVRAAAAAALRNLLLLLSVHGDEQKHAPIVAQLISEPFCAQLSALVGDAMNTMLAPDSAACHSNGSPLSERQQAVMGGTVFDEPDEGDVFETMRDAACSVVEELLQLISVVADASEPATTFFSDTSKSVVLPVVASAVAAGMDPQFHHTLSRCRAMESAGGASSDGTEIAAAAAEVLHFLSKENEAVSAFITSGLTPAQQQTMNLLTTDVPTSPSLLLISLHLSSALLSAMPTAANVQRALPALSAALRTQPFVEWRRVLPLLTEGCELVEEVRRASVKQAADRFRALQLACDILSDAVGIICEAHDDGEEDEAAFARNPHRGMILSSGILESTLAVLTDIFSPHEPVLQRALRERTDNTEVNTLQHAFAAVEAGIFGVVSSLMHLLPLDAFGPARVIWQTCVAVLAARHQQVCEGLAAGEQPATHPLLVLQIESLAEMCWTSLRKDTAREIPLVPADVDIFTQIAWEGYVSSQTAVFVVSVVGCVAARLRAPATHTSCGRFCQAVITHGLQQPDNAEHVEVAAEAANTLMDLFCDEDFDAVAYLPLAIHGTLSAFLPALKHFIASFGRRRSQKREHLEEIAENLEAFLKYKRSHTRGL